jgi:site-specific DNA recombinase
MADPILRCAVYTRKSTEDGLEQEFNSLDAQYEACAAYALSQRHEGWTVVADRYDDGGFSGGTMERPGLKRLMLDVAAGKIDVILIYKIDRLTRSLSDFSRIVDVLDKAKASFVSITQSFNTTTSMGRLTLNMLLSFAQFEREVTGERIRDKIAASKRKGIWMGGTVPLGYRVKDRRLVVVPGEAAQVRHIMERYIALGSVPELVADLERDGYRTKVQKGASGPHKGGCVYRRGTLYHLLSNRIYRGMTVHKDEAFPGEHEAIVEEQLWTRVQAQLKSNASGSSRRRGAEQPSLLTGLIFDDLGRPMTPSHSGKSRKTQRYRYYVTRPDALDGRPAGRVSASDLEAKVCERLAARIVEPGFLLDIGGDAAADAAAWRRSAKCADLIAAQLRSGTSNARADLLGQLLQRVTLAEDAVGLKLCGRGLAAALELAGSPPVAADLEVQFTAVRMRKGHQLRLVVPATAAAEPEPPCHDPKLIKLVAEAIKARELVLSSPDQSLQAIAASTGRCRTRLTKLVALSCLAPDIVRTIVEGCQPRGLTAPRLAGVQLPLDWAEQRTLLLGSAASPA